jgi:hypothetical protein
MVPNPNTYFATLSGTMIHHPIPHLINVPALPPAHFTSELLMERSDWTRRFGTREEKGMRKRKGWSGLGRETSVREKRRGRVAREPLKGVEGAGSEEAVKGETSAPGWGVDGSERRAKGPEK